MAFCPGSRADAGGVILRVADLVSFRQRPVRMFSRSVLLHFSRFVLEQLSKSLQQGREYELE